MAIVTNCGHVLPRDSEMGRVRQMNALTWFRYRPELPQFEGLGGTAIPQPTRRALLGPAGETYVLGQLQAVWDIDRDVKNCSTEIEPRLHRWTWEVAPG